MKLDMFAAAADRWLGSPAFVLGRIVQTHLWMQVVLQIAYGGLPLTVIATVAAYIYLKEEEFPRVLLAFILNLFVAIPIYLLIPICGPQFAFPSFPMPPASITLHPLAISAAPNGMPSVHTSTAILILWLARRWKAGRVLAAAYLVLIVLSTLASGEHYGIDLIAAVPYSAFILKVASLCERRWIAREESAGDLRVIDSDC